MIKITTQQIEASSDGANMDMNFQMHGEAEQIANEAVSIMTALPKELKSAGGTKLILLFLVKLSEQDHYDVDLYCGDKEEAEVDEQQKPERVEGN